MRVKVKGFEIGKSYEISAIDTNILLNIYVYFSKKNYVLMEVYDKEINSYRKTKVSKKFFKQFIDFPFSLNIIEINNWEFFDSYYNYIYNDNDCYYDYENNWYIEDGWVCEDPFDI